MTTPYDDLPHPESAAEQFKQCRSCPGITALPLYDENGICDFCGAALPWQPIELY
jgi:hypothetical protein